jgi:hypothetical protein
MATAANTGVPAVAPTMTDDRSCKAARTHADPRRSAAAPYASRGAAAGRRPVERSI